MTGAKRDHTISADQAAYSAALTAAGQARSASTQSAAGPLRSAAFAPLRAGSVVR